MIVYGASGHAKVIIDIIRSQGDISIDYVLDDNRSIDRILDFEVKHDLNDEMEALNAVIAIGNNSIRKKVAGRLPNRFIKALIHKSAILAENSNIEEGTVVMANAVINSSTRMGKHCIINTGSVIEHDVRISDFVHISPSATITGNVEIGEGSHIGAGAVVIPGIKIGEWVTVGAGAVIINDIPDYAVVVGNPGKIIKYNKISNE